MRLDDNDVACAVEAEQIDDPAEIRLDLFPNNEKFSVEDGDVAREPFFETAAQGRRAEADEQLRPALAFYRSVGAARYVREGEALLAASA